MSGSSRWQGYWASLKEPEDIAEAICTQVDEFDDFCLRTGLHLLWQRSARMYNSSLESSYIAQMGEDGEFTGIRINHYRSILRRVYVSTIADRPAFEPRAVNSDFSSRAQINTARGVLDYYMSELRLEKALARAAEMGVVVGEGAVVPIWNPRTGELRDRDEQSGRVYFTGDIEAEVLGPWDMIRDTDCELWERGAWVITRTWANRWDMIASYPEAAEEIKKISVDAETRTGQRARVTQLLWSSERGETDQIPVFTLYHKRTPAVPEGRVVTVLSEEVMIQDKTFEQLGMKGIPVARCAASEIFGEAFSSTFAYDLLQIQEMLDVLYSTVCTNQCNFGVQNFQSPDGALKGFEKLSNGMNLFTFVGERGLEALEMLKTPAEVFKLIQMLEGAMETLSAVNSVARGNPEASLKSGAALALVQSQFLEFTRDFQGSQALMVGDTGTEMVRLYKAHVDEPRMIAIVGRNGRSEMRHVSGKDIADIDRVIVDVGSYLTRTPAGRVNIADALLSAGQANADQYLSLITTGLLEPVLQGPRSELDLIQQENEELLEGRIPPVRLEDNHVLHIQEHKYVGADVEARRNPEVMRAMDEHQAAHLELLRGMDPVTAALFKQPVLAAPAAAPPEPQGGGEQGAAAGAGQAMAPEEIPGETGVPGVEYPTNPATGEEWQPAV